MREVLAIALGGAIGSVGRHAVGVLALRLLGSGFPWGTLLVNLAGSLVAGFLTGWVLEGAALSPALRLALLTGFLGAFTTFSTFSVDTVRLAERGLWGLAVLNVLLSVSIGLLSAWWGLGMARG